MFSGGDDGDCGYQFKKGETYVVFTQQECRWQDLFDHLRRNAPGKRSACADSSIARHAEWDANRFRIWSAAARESAIPGASGRPGRSLPNIALKLRSKDDRFSTSTGPDGIYTFYDVHAGEYNFTANLPVRMEFTQKTLNGALPPFKIPNGACYEYNVDALPTGHIRGSVLGPDGKPLKIASVELYRAGQYDDKKPGLWGFQSIHGYFDFDHIGPGEYVLVYNRSNRHDPNSPFPRSFFPGTTNPSGAEPHCSERRAATHESRISCSAKATRRAG